MFRVVFDTNVILDCWVFDDPAVQPLKIALDTRRAVAVRSRATDAELLAVLTRPGFGLDAAGRDALFARWCATALLIDVAAMALLPIRCSDPDDEKFLHLASAARARLLITKDKALLATAPRARAYGLRVLSPSAAVAELER